MNLTACTVTETGMTLAIELTLDGGTHDAHTERSSHWLDKAELIAWANRTLRERWGVTTEWWAPADEFDRIVLEAAIGEDEPEEEEFDDSEFWVTENPADWA
jgi:hypothetical protein